MQIIIPPTPVSFQRGLRNKYLFHLPLSVPVVPCIVVVDETQRAVLFEEPAKNLHFNCDERDRTRNRRNDRLPVILHPRENREGANTVSLSFVCQYEILYFWIVAEETVARDDKRVHNGGVSMTRQSLIESWKDVRIR